MYKLAWDEIEALYNKPNIDKATIQLFKQLKSSQTSHTKKEANSHHYCSFFLPFDAQTNSIYLGHHIKANDWIPPGGHIEPGETPIQAAIREAKEELGIVIDRAQLYAFDLSIKPINNSNRGCLTHYDVWHLLNIPVTEFDFLKSEYYTARWFPIKVGIAMIKNNPDFAAIIRKLL